MVKLFGFPPILIGTAVGGIIMLRIGINRSLWIFGALQAVSTAGFCILARSGHSLPLLARGKVRDIYAVGDVTGPPGLASAAYDQGRFVYETFSDRSIERSYVNRSWSAAADGYIDEVSASLDRAREHVLHAQRLVQSAEGK